MKISSRFSVAVHILSLLSVNKGDHNTSEWIAGSVNTNPAVIRKLTGMLKKAGLVYVRAGAGGAYLAKALDTITLLDVFRAVEAVEEGELFHFHDAPNPNCPVGSNIQSALEWVLLRAQTEMEQVLAKVTMQELVIDLQQKISLSAK